MSNFAVAKFVARLMKYSCLGKTERRRFHKFPFCGLARYHSFFVRILLFDNVLHCFSQRPPPTFCNRFRPHFWHVKRRGGDICRTSTGILLFWLGPPVWFASPPRRALDPVVGPGGICCTSNGILLVWVGPPVGQPHGPPVALGSTEMYRLQYAKWRCVSWRPPWRSVVLKWTVCSTQRGAVSVGGRRGAR